MSNKRSVPIADNLAVTLIGETDPDAGVIQLTTQIHGASSETIELFNAMMAAVTQRFASQAAKQDQA